MSRPVNVEKSLSYSNKTGCFHAIMIGGCEAYFIAYAIFLSADGFIVGLIASIPPLIGALGQVMSIYYLDRMRERRLFVSFSSLFQAVTCAAIFVIPTFFPDYAFKFLIPIIALYFLLGYWLLPAWNSWIGDLVPEAIRGRYFGNRNRLKQICELSSFLAAGLILNFAKGMDETFYGFAIIFSIATTSRLISSYMHFRIDEPEYQPPEKHQKFSFFDFVRQFGKSNFANFAILVGFFWLATNLAAPFFTLYMLRDLGFSYLQFSTVFGASLISQVIVYYQWGILSDRFGNKTIMTTAAVMISLIPLLWLFTTNFYLLICVELFSGIAWAGFNLGSANFLFDAVTPAKRGRCAAYFSLMVNTGIFFGALIGGSLAAHLGKTITTSHLSITMLSNIYPIFALSSLFRFVVALILMNAIHEVRKVEHTTPWNVARTMIGFYAPFALASRFTSFFFRKAKD